MSTYIVSEEHITAMLNIMSPKYPGDAHSYYWNGTRHPFGGNKQAIGQKLLDENYRSVNYRYSENIPTPKFTLKMVHSRTPVETLKACVSYSYQTCETPDWQESEAFAIVQEIKACATRKLEGNEEASWEIRE